MINKTTYIKNMVRLREEKKIPQYDMGLQAGYNHKTAQSQISVREQRGYGWRELAMLEKYSLSLGYDHLVHYIIDLLQDDSNGTLHKIRETFPNTTEKR